MPESTVRQLAFATGHDLAGLVQNWTHELHAVNDNEPPAPRLPSHAHPVEATIYNPEAASLEAAA